MVHFSGAALVQPVKMLRYQRMTGLVTQQGTFLLFRQWHASGRERLKAALATFGLRYSAAGPAKTL